MYTNLDDSFAWRSLVCETAEEELRQLEGKVREKGQVVHDIRSETLKEKQDSGGSQRDREMETDQDIVLYTCAVQIETYSVTVASHHFFLTL